ncbi:zinc finger BED domain-containing protein [Plectropomus leopardus]|uniref:zinc finger BED domain-containing protein n=1 Tax=Plectropomus leopardus TaxID=160734 RepID=UPI001C4B367A|nr:zinc finger BED domain-containing protein [Plectropomus leopardus]
MVRKRSVVWGFFKAVDSESAQCLLCGDYLVKSGSGTTTNLLRHLRVKHPTAVVRKSKGRLTETTPINGHEDMEAGSERFCSVEVALEEGDAETLTTENEAGINSAINSILEAAHGGPAEEITHGKSSVDHPVTRRWTKRSLIWRHYERLDSLAAARCRICMKKLQCFEGGSTSNLHRHMSKRHPEMFSQLFVDGRHPPTPHASQGSSANGDTSTPPESAGATEKQRQFSGLCEGERRMFRRERELIEALRSAQREEARALEHQRELLDKLRTVNAREAAAEREQIESLRKAQLEEAKDLSRQREELQKEKAELQRKREELRQEREELVLFSRGRQAS